MSFLEIYAANGLPVTGISVNVGQMLTAFTSGATYTFPTNFTMASSSAFLPCQSSFAGAQTVSLPIASGSGNFLIIMDTGGTAAAHNVTLSGTVIGVNILSVAYQCLILLDSNVGWACISN